jgi:hypothetical protein
VWVGTDAGESEFDHVGLRNNHRACGANPVHHRRVGCCGWSIDEHLGPRAGRLTGDIEQVLDAEYRAIEWTKRYAGTRSGIRPVGGVASDLRIHSEAGTGTLALWIGYASESFF